MGYLAERGDGDEMRHFINETPIFSGDILEVQIGNDEWGLARYERRFNIESMKLSSVFWIVDEESGVQIEITTDRHCRLIDEKSDSSK